MGSDRAWAAAPTCRLDGSPQHDEVAHLQALGAFGYAAAVTDEHHLGLAGDRAAGEPSHRKPFVDPLAKPRAEIGPLGSLRRCRLAGMGYAPPERDR